MTSRIMWTSASVHLLSGRAGNPIEVMESNARAMALKAMDKGWTGPPFDPIRLAEALGMEVEACEDVTEARVRFLDTGPYRIEFNPSRPQARIFFSVAHEIAHTLSPDCRQRVRHRGAHESVAPDDWQIEVLCNVGAAELLMPIGSFGSLRDLGVTIEQIVDLRKKYQVSSEALLLRFVKVSDKPCAAFSASRGPVVTQKGIVLSTLLVQRAGLPPSERDPSLTTPVQLASASQLVLPRGEPKLLRTGRHCTSKPSAFLRTPAKQRLGLRACSGSPSRT